MRLELDDLVVVDDPWSPFCGKPANVLDTDLDGLIEVVFADGTTEAFDRDALDFIDRPT